MAIPGSERKELERVMRICDDVPDDIVNSIAKSSTVMPSSLMGLGYDEVLYRMALEIKRARLIFKIANEDL